MATPTWALAERNSSSDERTSGRCSTSCDGTLTGSSVGSCRPASLNVSHRLLARKPARQCGKKIALLRQCLAQRRQGRLDLGQRRLLGGNVAAIGVALHELATHDFEHLRIDVDELVGGLDLAAQRRLLDRRHDHIGTERQVGGLDQEALVIRLRLQRFHRPAILPPHVEGVRHHDLGGVEIE